MEKRKTTCHPQNSPARCRWMSFDGRGETSDELDRNVNAGVFAFEYTCPPIGESIELNFAAPNLSGTAPAFTLPPKEERFASSTRAALRCNVLLRRRL